ncbi:MAG: hypothetical protein HC923_06010 [Myxococcales bacterium]|nr:hypothetical protein [Myxococcales bacterium]
MNDTLGEATPLTIGSPGRGRIATTSDFDYYSFEVSGASTASPKVYSVEVAWEGSAPQGLELQFSLLDEAGLLVCPANEPACLSLRRLNDGSFTEVRCHDNVSCVHAIPFTRNGRYHVLVQDFQDDAFSESGQYRVTVQEVPKPADDDENYSDAATPGRSDLGARSDHPRVRGDHRVHLVLGRRRHLRHAVPAVAVSGRSQWGLGVVRRLPRGWTFGGRILRRDRRA